MFLDTKEYGDPPPLAVLSSVPRKDGRGARKAAQAWATQHPDALGYIEIPMGDGGSHFFSIEAGKAHWSGAQDCHPKFFAAQDRRAKERVDYRTQWLKHPQCPCCSCTRTTPRKVVDGKKRKV